MVQCVYHPMSKYYTPQRTRGIFQPDATKPFALSRSKIELFLECPRCFYLDRRLGVGRPPGYPFSLNTAVDTLLKKEFDVHRAAGTPHPLMQQYGIAAVPFAHDELDNWRENFKGVRYHHAKTNLEITGAVDDIWQGDDGKLIVVDYKSTSKSGEVDLDADWQMGYKRQMEVYQWLLRRNKFDVSDVGYFVYCNGNTDRAAFDAKLEFDIKVIPYAGDDRWIEATLLEISRVLSASALPKTGLDCDYCAYRAAVEHVDH